MGKGKGSFDHWAARVAVNQVVFEIKGMLHEAVVRDAFRLAGNKLPGKSNHRKMGISPLLTLFQGQWEFAQKGDPPIVGITKLKDVTLEDLKRPRKIIAPQELLDQALPKPTEAAAGSPASAST